MRKLTSSLALVALLGCKTDDSRPPPMEKGRCFVMDFVDDRAAYQWCQFDNFWYECWTGEAHTDTCKRRQMLTAEDRAAAEKPADPITKK